MSSIQLKTFLPLFVNVFFTASVCPQIGWGVITLKDLVDVENFLSLHEVLLVLFVSLLKLMWYLFFLIFFFVIFDHLLQFPDVVILKIICLLISIGISLRRVSFS